MSTATALGDHAVSPPPARITGQTHIWEMVIGLEVHAQVASRAKLFSAAATAFGAEPNHNVSLVDAAMPGMLPVVNRFCIDQAVRTGLGLQATINLYSAFDRKNYFYPDLPQGYQISQLYHPIVGEGGIVVALDDGCVRYVRIERLHLEQDAGKSIHDMDATKSFIDLNRTGVALMEIVSKPDVRSASEAIAYVATLRQIMRYLGTCDGDMQNGNLRADVNVSVCRSGDYERFRETGDIGHLGTRCEIKNMNSLRFIGQAIDFEAKRQIAVLEDGGCVRQETRLFDANRGETRAMRSKEQAHDYRYFPCPDLLPLQLTQAEVDAIKATLPELPHAKKQRFVREYGITDYDAAVLTADIDSADFFEQTARGRSGKLAANWVINALFGRLNKAGLGIKDSPVSAAQLGAILDLTERGEISSKAAKQVFDAVWDGGGDPAAIVRERGLQQMNDADAITQMVQQLIADNPAQVAKYANNPKLLGWFVGQVMQHTGGTANPKTVNALVQNALQAAVNKAE